VVLVVRGGHGSGAGGQETVKPVFETFAHIAPAPIIGRIFVHFPEDRLCPGWIAGVSLLHRLDSRCPFLMVRRIQARRVCAVGDAGREFDGLTHGPIAGDAGFCDEADGLGDFVDRRDGFEAERALVTVGVLGVVRVGAAVGGVVVDGHGLWCWWGWWGFGVVAGTGQGGWA